MQENLSQKNHAFNYVVNLLSRRDYSEMEIRQKMQQKAFSENDIQYAITRTQEYGWQSDFRFTENYIRSRTSKGYGLKRIRQELIHLKGISDSLIMQTLQQMEAESQLPHWQTVALQTLQKKFPHFQQKQSPKEKQKIWQYMLNKGFSSEDFAHFLEADDEEIESYFEL